MERDSGRWYSQSALEIDNCGRGGCIVLGAGCMQPQEYMIYNSVSGGFLRSLKWIDSMPLHPVKDWCLGHGKTVPSHRSRLSS